MKRKLIDNIKSFFNNILSREGMDIEEKGRRKLFVIFLIIIIILLIVFGIERILIGAYVYGISDLIMSCLLISFILVLRVLKNGQNIYRVSMFLLGLLLLYWIKTGAVNGYASMWGIGFPLMAFFLMGKKEGLFWSSTIVILTLLLFINPYSILQVYVYSASFISRYIAVFIMVLFITYNYESVREKFKIGIEREQERIVYERNRLAEAKKELETANRLLKKEMEKKKRAEVELMKHRDHLEELVSDRTNKIKEKNEELTAALSELEVAHEEVLNSREELVVSENRYRLLANNVTDLIFSTDMDMNFVYISPSVENMYGYTVEEAMQLPHDKWCTPESYKKLMEVYHEQIDLEKNGTANLDRNIILQLEHIKKDSTTFIVEQKISYIRESNMNAIGVVGITRDITERIKAQKEKEEIQNQLAQAQKMDSIGTLVGGLAHDFNNILGGIMGSLSIIQMLIDNEDLEKKDEIQKYLQLGVESSKRSSDLIKQLMALARKHELTLSLVDINYSLSHIFELCKNTLPKSIKLDFKISKTPLMAMADLVQIEQVLLNLCINASHAMTIMGHNDGKKGGTLTVSSEKITADEELIKMEPDASDINNWIRIRVMDTGVGMDKETMGRVFEPFYTTKEQEDGTGLGLSITYSILKQHNGFIHVNSEPGRGSNFTVYLPYLDEKDIDFSVDDRNKLLVAGTGTILIVDDEPTILKIAKGIFEQCGYNAIIAHGAENGIAQYRARYEEISAVLLDMAMPGKSGLDVFEELVKINPKVRALLSSGMLDTESREKALKLGILDTINKPYMPQELSEKMSIILR